MEILISLQLTLMVDGLRLSDFVMKSGEKIFSAEENKNATALESRS